MQIELEDLDYQRRAIATVLEVLDGQTPNKLRTLDRVIA